MPSPEVDLRKAGGPEGLVQLGAVVDVVGEDPLQDPSTVVDPLLVTPSATDLLVQHVEGPVIQAVLDDPEGRVQRLDERAWHRAGDRGHRRPGSRRRRS